MGSNSGLFLSNTVLPTERVDKSDKELNKTDVKEEKSSPVEKKVDSL
jgi:hypothetical protein